MITDKTLKRSPRDIFSDYLARHNKRRTAERFAIVDCVIGTPDHFTIDSFHERLESQGFHVSLATIYSTLNLMIDCGLVRRHRFGSDSARYERTVGSSSHHHLVCSRCGKVKEIRDAALSAEISSRRYPGFLPGYFSLSIFGLCRSCQKKDRNLQHQNTLKIKSDNSKQTNRKK